MKKKNYPRKDGDRAAYAQYPVQITEAMAASADEQNFPMASEYKVGHWIAVNVALPSGYHLIPTASPQMRKSVCLKGCQIHNNYYGFTPEEVEGLVSQSMGNPQKMKLKPTLTAVFRGIDGADGYSSCFTYQLNVKGNTVRRLDGSGRVVYRSMEAFLNIWEPCNIKTL